MAAAIKTATTNTPFNLYYSNQHLPKQFRFVVVVVVDHFKCLEARGRR